MSVAKEQFLEDNMIKKYICPNCGVEIPYIRYTEGESHCTGLTTKCNKCKKIIPIKIISADKITIKL